MSLILEGIDLPKEGELTFIAVCNDGRTYKMAMPPTGVLRLGPYADLYQAIQIPKDHGRIGDLDGVIKQIDKSPTFASKYKGTAKLFIDVYSDSNTILEAERRADEIDDRLLADM